MYLDYTGIRVTNLARSVRFYTRTLGLREVRRGDTRVWGGGIWVLLKDPKSGCLLELNWYPRGSIFYTRYRRGEELDHLDFSLGSVSRAVLERTYRKVLKGGARATRFRPSTTEGWSAMVKDPDGVWIAIYRQPTPAEQRKANAKGGG